MPQNYLFWGVIIRVFAIAPLNRHKFLLESRACVQYQKNFSKLHKLILYFG